MNKQSVEDLNKQIKEQIEKNLENESKYKRLEFDFNQKISNLKTELLQTKTRLQETEKSLLENPYKKMVLELEKKNNELEMGKLKLHEEMRELKNRLQETDSKYQAALQLHEQKKNQHDKLIEQFQKFMNENTELAQVKDSAIATIEEWKEKFKALELEKENNEKLIMAEYKNLSEKLKTCEADKLKEVSRLSSENHVLKEKVSHLKKKLEDTHEESKEIQQELEELEAENNNLTQELESAKKKQSDDSPLKLSKLSSVNSFPDLQPSLSEVSAVSNQSPQRRLTRRNTRMTPEELASIISTPDQSGKVQELQLTIEQMKNNYNQDIESMRKELKEKMEYISQLRQELFEATQKQDLAIELSAQIQLLKNELAEKNVSSNNSTGNVEKEIEYLKNELKFHEELNVQTKIMLAETMTERDQFLMQLRQIQKTFHIKKQVYNCYDYV